MQKLKGKYADASVNFDDENWMEVKEYTPGKRVKKIRIGNKELARNRGQDYFWIKISKFYNYKRRQH